MRLEDKKLDARSCAIRVCENMTNAGFMSGVMGDTSRDFVIQQSEGLLNQTRIQFIRWVDNQGNNLNSALVSHLDIALILAGK